MRCINIDWLQLFGMLDNPDELSTLVKNAGLIFKDNERGTRNFKSWYTIYTENGQFPLAQICCHPYSIRGMESKGIFHPNAATLQLCNRFCYAPDPIDIISKIARIIRFKFRSISHLDLCYDFRQFDNQMKPLTLIRGYYNASYWKMGWNKALGVGRQSDMYDGETLSFKGKNSAVGVKIYNKSRELKDVHEKPYVRDAWRECGLAGDEDVWRLEISIKSDGRTIVNIGTGQVIQFSLKDIYRPEQRAALFFIFAKKYWHWRYHKPGVRKTLSKDIELFNYSNTEDVWKPIKLTMTKDYGKKAKVIMNALKEIIESNDMSVDERENAMKTMLTISKHYRVLPDGVLPPKPKK